MREGLSHRTATVCHQGPREVWGCWVTPASAATDGKQIFHVTPALFFLCPTGAEEGRKDFILDTDREVARPVRLEEWSCGVLRNKGCRTQPNSPWTASCCARGVTAGKRVLQWVNTRAENEYLVHSSNITQGRVVWCYFKVLPPSGELENCTKMEKLF